MTRVTYRFVSGEPDLPLLCECEWQTRLLGAHTFGL